MTDIEADDLDVEITEHKSEERTGLRVSGAEEKMSALLARIDTYNAMKSSLEVAKKEVAELAEALADEYGADTIRFLSNEERSIDVVYSFPNGKPIVADFAKLVVKLPEDVRSALFTEETKTVYIPKDEAGEALDDAFAADDIAEKTYMAIKKKFVKYHTPTVTVKNVASNKLPWEK